MSTIYLLDSSSLTGTTRETCPDLNSEPVNCHNDGHCNVCRRVLGTSPYLHSGCNYFSSTPSCDVDLATSGIQSSGVGKRAVCTACKKEGKSNPENPQSRLITVFHETLRIQDEN